jgi:hypothetical protein
MRWLAEGVTSSKNTTDVTPSTPDKVILGGGRLIVEGSIGTPPLQGVSVVSRGLVDAKTLVISFDKAAFFAKSASVSLPFITIPSRVRITKVVLDVEELFLGIGNVVTAEVGNTTGAGENGYLLPRDVTSGPLPLRVGTLVSDLGTRLHPATGMVGGDVPTWQVGAATQLTLTLKSTGGAGKPLGTGKESRLESGRLTVYVTLEPML